MLVRHEAELMRRYPDSEGYVWSPGAFGLRRRIRRIVIRRRRRRAREPEEEPEPGGDDDIIYL